MTNSTTDQRDPSRRARDEQIAAEPRLEPLDLPTNAPFASIEAHLDRGRRHPVAVEGIVENGMVRPLDPGVKLPEHSRVIIVASGQS